MRKILYITAFPPNNITAGQNYSRQLIEDLSSEYYVDVIYWSYPHHGVQIKSKVGSYVEIGLNKTILFEGILTFLFPLFSRRFSTKALKQIKSRASNYDILYFDFSQTFIFSRFINHPYKIGMAHDVILQKYCRTRIGRFLKSWIKISEKLCLSGLNKVLTFSFKDKKILKNEYGIDANIVPFYLDNKINRIDLLNIKIEDYFVMYGAWNRLENQESIDWVLDNYPINRPRIKILGGSMPQSILEKIEKIDEVEYLGFIDDPYNIIAKSKGLIAPLFHGAGVKVKAIESLALGTPIIGTHVTFEGLPAVYNSMIRVMNMADLSAAISQLDSLTVSDKINIQKIFRQTYILKSFKEQLLNEL